MWAPGFAHLCSTTVPFPTAHLFDTPTLDSLARTLTFGRYSRSALRRLVTFIGHHHADLALSHVSPLPRNIVPHPISSAVRPFAMSWSTLLFMPRPSPHLLHNHLMTSFLSPFRPLPLSDTFPTRRSLSFRFGLFYMLLSSPPPCVTLSSAATSADWRGRRVRGHPSIVPRARHVRRSLSTRSSRYALSLVLHWRLRPSHPHTSCYPPPLSLRIGEGVVRTEDHRYFRAHAASDSHFHLVIGRVRNGIRKASACGVRLASSRHAFNPLSFVP